MLRVYRETPIADVANAAKGALSKDLVRSATPPALRLAAAFLQFFATVWIARTLGEVQAGDYFFWAAVLMSFGSVATVGLDELALQQIPRIHEDKEELSNFLGGIRAIAILIALAIGLALIGYAVFVQEDAKRPLAWYAMLPVCVAGIALCRINGEAMKGMGRPLLAIVYRQFLAGSVLLLALVAIGASLTPESALACFTIAFVFAGFAAPGGVGFSGLGHPYRFSSMARTARNLKLGAPLCAAALFTAFTYILPLAILEQCHPSEEISFVTTAYRIFLLFDLLALAIHSIAMPRLSRAGHSENLGLMRTIYFETIRKGMLIMGLPLVAIFFAAPLVMSLFGQAFTSAAPILQVFLLFGAVSLLLGPAMQLVLMIGHTKRLAAFALGRMAVTVLIGFIFVPGHGALAMAIAIGAGILLQKSACLWHFLRHAKTVSPETV